MKGIFKLMTAVVAFGALASCSTDDLGIDNAAKQAALDKADLVGSLNANTSFTRIGFVDELTNGRLSDLDIVWTEGDQVRVFTMDAMTYNVYVLDPATAGQSTGAFTKTQAFSPLKEGELYAITEGQDVYSVSPNEDGEAQLTMTIPRRYDAQEDLLAETGINKFPAPYWGIATVDEEMASSGTPEYKLNVGFKALTSFLRIDLTTLPAGTQAIVLTTHGGETHPNRGMNNANPWQVEGFQLFSEEDIDNPMSYDDWMALYRKANHKSWITGGQSEPLSGTLNCVLAQGKGLSYDDRLVSSDTLRIDLQNVPYMKEATTMNGKDQLTDADKVIYVPIVAGLYHNLHVIAVTQDSPLSYQWVGEDLATYVDQEFKLNKIEQFRMKVTVDISDVTSWKELSDLIYKESINPVNAGRTLKIDVDKDLEGDELYIDSELELNNVTLNLATATTEDLTIVEGIAEVKANGDIAWDFLLETPAPSASERTLELNINEEDENTFEITTPSTDIIIGTNGNVNGKATVNVLAASTKQVTGLDLIQNGAPAISNEKNATVTVKNGLKKLSIMPESVGDVYVYTGGQEETEISESLIIGTEKEISVRLTDALVNTIYAVDAENVKRMVYTTGSSAIQKVLKATVSDSEVTPATYTDGDIDDDSFAPEGLHVLAFWTGAALTDYAIKEGYDCGRVYTTAQLASAGEETQAAYFIPRKVVTEMWLGGSEYPWIGAQVDVNGFEFNGNVVSLQNMTLDTNDNSFIDPHHCCTSCGPVRKLNVSKNLGLFRSIINADTATVVKVNLNDVLLDTDAAIDNIGSLVGYVETPVAYFEDNAIGEVKIDVNGENIGGMIGKSVNETSYTSINNVVTGKTSSGKDNGWIRSTKDNVGGQAGYVKAGNIGVGGGEVDLDGEIVSTGGTKGKTIYGNNVGGCFGNAIATEESVAVSYFDVKVADQIKGYGNNIGGIAGNVDAKKTTAINKNNVETPLIESEEGGYVGGAVGHTQDLEGATYNDNEVNVDAINANGDSYVGGIAGRLDTKGGADFSGNKVVVDEQIYTVNQNAGGLIGLSKVEGTEQSLNIFSADINVELIQAEEGYVGGEIGAVYKGRTVIGYEKKDGTTDATHAVADKAYNTNVDIEKLAGAYAVGGLVGDNTAKVNVWAYVTDARNNKWSKVNIDINEFENTKDEAYFDNNNKEHAYGTMSNILGYMDADLYIYKKNDALNVTDHLDKDMKAAVLYKWHPNRQYTVPENYAFYWGDTNGYVGWGHSGTYLINGSQVKADQIKGGFNLSKTEANYD